MEFISALDVLKEQSPAMTGFQVNPENDNNILFSTPLGPDKKRYFNNFRIGREVATKAGFSDDDVVVLRWNVEHRVGLIEAVAAEKGGWKLAKGSKSEKPPLVLRFTWHKKYPSTAKTVLCKVIKIAPRYIQFKFPENTSFGELAKPDDEQFDELYEHHRGMVDKCHMESARRPKKQELNRRKADKAPMMKDGKPYGRRKGDLL